MRNRDKILEKLRKLMNLEASARNLGNEGEANAAAAGISRLLMEYNLSMEDIPEEEKIDNPVVAEEIPYKAEMSDGPWFKNLVIAVCHFNFCRPLIVSNYDAKLRRRKRDSFRIVGRKKNIEVVLYLISFLSHQFVSIGRKNYPEYKCRCIQIFGLKPAGPARYMKSFLFGCVDGLYCKFQESSQDSKIKENVTALSISTAAEIDDFLKEEKIYKGRSYKPDIDAISAIEGIKEGKNVEIHKGIHQNSVPKENRLEHF